jgi:hypothetical protein
MFVQKNHHEPPLKIKKLLMIAFWPLKIVVKKNPRKCRDFLVQTNLTIESFHRDDETTK